MMQSAVAYIVRLTGVVAFSLGASGAGAQSPSFDCATNYAPDEITICRNNSLTSLDRQMATLYFALVRSLLPDQQIRLRNEQRSWLKQRASCLRSAACISAAYQARISQLNTLSGSAAPGEPRSPTPPGSGDACDMFPMLCR
jgi:uncharacterized protein